MTLTDADLDRIEAGTRESGSTPPWDVEALVAEVRACRAQDTLSDPAAWGVTSSADGTGPIGSVGTSRARAEAVARFEGGTVVALVLAPRAVAAAPTEDEKDAAAHAIHQHQVEYVDSEVGYACGCDEDGSLDLPDLDAARTHQAVAVLAAARAVPPAPSAGEDEAVVEQFDASTRAPHAHPDYRGPIDRTKQEKAP